MEWKQLLCEDRIREAKKSSKSTDNRSEFEKDYHRIIGSASFRRLQDKTQVFPLDNSDFIRTRLTHSLEVSSIAKSLGQTVGQSLHEKNRISYDEAKAIEDILLCAGLLHDIGNPPFGHFGETVIRDWFRANLERITYKGVPLTQLLSKQQQEDLYNFEGNAQSLRVVTRLHYLVGESGMNLTKGLLNTIIKYPVASTRIGEGHGDIRFKKMGYFKADEAAFKDITESTGAHDKRHPLTFLLEAADDIAYSTADIEDGVKKGALSYQKLFELLEDEASKSKGEKIYEDIVYSPRRLEKLYNRALDNKEPNPELYAVQNWIITIQSMLIRAACESFLAHEKELLEGSYNQDLFYGTHAQKLIGALKRIAYENVFQIKPILRLEIAADRIISFLLEEFVTAAAEYDSGVKLTEKKEKLMQLVSVNYRRIYENESRNLEEGDRLYLRMLLVTDYVSGMTDHYAKALYQELNGI